MAFITIEDLVGTLEIIIFPKDYERNSSLLEIDSKVFVKGRISTEEEKNGKLICQNIFSFEDTKKELWLKFNTLSEYTQSEGELKKQIESSDGNDGVVIYIAETKMMKRMPASWNVKAESEIVNNLTKFLGENNVKVVEKSIENGTKRY